jgi:hypothetical protein
LFSSGFHILLSNSSLFTVFHAGLIALAEAVSRSVSRSVFGSGIDISPCATTGDVIVTDAIFGGGVEILNALLWFLA